MSVNNRQNGRRRGRNTSNNNSRPQSGGQGRGDSGNRIDNRARGNAAQLLEKYRNMARDAQMSSDRVMTEYYLQFADHYFRVLSDARVRQEEQRGRFEERDGAEPRNARDDGGDADRDMVDDDDEFGNSDEQLDAIDQIGRAPRNRDAGRSRDNPRDNPREGGARENGVRENGQQNREPRNYEGREDNRQREAGRNSGRDGQRRDYGSANDRPQGDRLQGDRPQSDRPQSDRPLRNEADRAPTNDGDRGPRNTIDRPARSIVPSSRPDSRRAERADPDESAAIDIAVLPPAIGIEMAVAASAGDDETTVPKRRGRPRKAASEDTAPV